MPLLAKKASNTDHKRRSFVIYNVPHAPQKTLHSQYPWRSGWMRYGAVNSAREAIDIARELYASEEFYQVEVHEHFETQSPDHSLQTKSCKVRLFKRFGGAAWDASWPILLLALVPIMALCTAFYLLL